MPEVTRAVRHRWKSIRNNQRATIMAQIEDQEQRVDLMGKNSVACNVTD